MANQLGWVIVKEAAGSYWTSRFSNDPKVHGALLSHSCYLTDLSCRLGVEDYYMKKTKAEDMCSKLNDIDPYGSYAVCPMLDGFDGYNNTDTDDDD